MMIWCWIWNSQKFKIFIKIKIYKFTFFGLINYYYSQCLVFNRFYHVQIFKIMFIHTEAFFFLLIRKFKIGKGFILVHVVGFIGVILVIIIHVRRHSIHVIGLPWDIGVFFIAKVLEGKVLVVLIKVCCVVIVIWMELFERCFLFDFSENGLLERMNKNLRGNWYILH